MHYYIESGYIYMENNDYAVQDGFFKKGLAAIILACTVSIVGLIIAIMNKKNIKSYLAQGGELYGKGKTGNILSTIAIPVAIVEIVCVAIYFIYFVLIIGAVAAGSLS